MGIMAVYIKDEGEGKFTLRDFKDNKVQTFNSRYSAKDYAHKMKWHYCQSLSDAICYENERRVKDGTFTDGTMCVFVGGALDGKKMTVGDVLKTKKVIGKMNDMSEYRKSGYLCYAHIFDNAPKVEGYVGPMWGGLETPFRYETSEVYAQMSI